MGFRRLWSNLDLQAAGGLTWYFKGYNVRQKPLVLCLLGQTVGAQCVFILLQPRHSKGGSQSVCRVAHGLAGGELSHSWQLGRETGW